MTRNIKLAVVMAVGGVLALSACAAAGEPWNDAAVDHKNDRPAMIGSMPDGFANWSEKCDDFGNLVITTRGGGEGGGGKAVAVVKDEEACAKYDKGASAWKKAK